MESKFSLKVVTSESEHKKIPERTQVEACTGHLQLPAAQMIDNLCSREITNKLNGTHILFKQMVLTHLVKREDNGKSTTRKVRLIILEHLINVPINLLNFQGHPKIKKNGLL